MTNQNWRVRVDSRLPQETIEAIIRKESLIKMGGVGVEGTVVTPTRRGYCLLVSLARSWSDSSTNISEPKNRKATGKVVMQMRNTVPAKSPLIEEGLAETELSYPRDKVIHIRKGLRLKKRG